MIQMSLHNKIQRSDIRSVKCIFRNQLIFCIIILKFDILRITHASFNNCKISPQDALPEIIVRRWCIFWENRIFLF